MLQNDDVSQMKSYFKGESAMKKEFMAILLFVSLILANNSAEALDFRNLALNLRALTTSSLAMGVIYALSEEGNSRLMERPQTSKAISVWLNSFNLLSRAGLVLQRVDELKLIPSIIKKISAKPVNLGMAVPLEAQEIQTTILPPEGLDPVVRFPFSFYIAETRNMVSSLFGKIKRFVETEAAGTSVSLCTHFYATSVSLCTYFYATALFSKAKIYKDHKDHKAFIGCLAVSWIFRQQKEFCKLYQLIKKAKASFKVVEENINIGLPMNSPHEIQTGTLVATD